MLMSWFSVLPIIDTLFAGFYLWTLMKAWENVKPSLEKDDIDERSLGASVIMGQLNAVITGSSIIIAGIAAFVALGKSGIGSPQDYHLLYAAIWAVSALGLAQYTMGVLPHRTPKQSFVKSKDVAILSGMALFFSLLAGFRLLFGIGSFLFSTNAPQLPS